PRCQRMQLWRYETLASRLAARLQVGRRRAGEKRRSGCDGFAVGISVADVTYNSAVPDYSIAGLDNVLTPALAIYTSLVDANIDFTLELVGGDANRWRPHVKTAKLESMMRRLVARG